MNYTDRMKEIAQIGDAENAHYEADKVLCEILRKHGHNELVDIYENMDKWYA